jgi:hypothetical protein
MTKQNKLECLLLEVFKGLSNIYEKGRERKYDHHEAPRHSGAFTIKLLSIVFAILN